MGAALRLLLEGIPHTDSVGRVHVFGDLVAGHPADLAGFFGGVRRLVTGTTAVDEGNNAARHVLIDARELVDVHDHAGFLGDLAAHAVLELFGEFEDTAGHLPVTVVAAADDQDALGGVDYDACHAHRVFRGLAHGSALPAARACPPMTPWYDRIEHI